MPVGVTRQSSPPGDMRRQACASQEPKVSSPSSPRSAWLAFTHTPAGVADAISANPLFAIDLFAPLPRPRPFWTECRPRQTPLAQPTHADALSETAQPLCLRPPSIHQYNAML